MLAVASREEAKVVQRKEGNANSGNDKQNPQTWESDSGDESNSSLVGMTGKFGEDIQVVSYKGNHATH